MTDNSGAHDAAPTPGAGHSRAPAHADAALVLEDGSVFWGRGAGAAGVAIGEICFNTAITGYQEILTDPSYAGQIITFTFPHIGNVGANPEDIETMTPAARGCVLRAPLPNRPTGVRRSIWIAGFRPTISLPSPASIPAH